MEHFEDIGPSVVLASPGMMQSGLSRELFESWCTDKRNGCIIAGYCVEGTLAKVHTFRSLYFKAIIFIISPVQTVKYTFSLYPSEGIFSEVRTFKPLDFRTCLLKWMICSNCTHISDYCFCHISYTGNILNLKNMLLSLRIWNTIW